MLIVLSYDCASPPALEPLAALTQHFLDLIGVALIRCHSLLSAVQAAHIFAVGFRSLIAYRL